MKDTKDELISKQEELILHHSCKCPECKKLESEISVLEKELEQEPESGTAEEILNSWVPRIKDHPNYNLDDLLKLKGFLEPFILKAMESYAQSKQLLIRDILNNFAKYWNKKDERFITYTDISKYIKLGNNVW